MTPYRFFRKQIGQSMTEYTVVLVFGVLALTTGPGGDAVQQLLDVMKENYEGYSFAVSLSEPPDYDDVLTYRTELSNQGLEDDEIDKLAVDPADLFRDMTQFNKDPLRQLTSGIDTLKNCISQVPTSIGQLRNNRIQCP